jgi:hypothetical protein
MADSVECVGVIFQFNGNGVLFEFSTEAEDDAVGFVRAVDIKINGTDSIPAEANTTELLAKYLQVISRGSIL